MYSRSESVAFPKNSPEPLNYSVLDELLPFAPDLLFLRAKLKLASEDQDHPDSEISSLLERAASGFGELGFVEQQVTVLKFLCNTFPEHLKAAETLSQLLTKLGHKKSALEVKGEEIPSTPAPSPPEDEIIIDCKGNVLRFLRLARRGIRSYLLLDIAGAEISLKVHSDYTVEKVIEKLGENNSSEIRDLFEGQSLFYKYEPARFDPRVVMDFFYGLEKCEGPLKQRLQEFAIAWYAENRDSGKVISFKVMESVLSAVPSWLEHEAHKYQVLFGPGYPWRRHAKAVIELHKDKKLSNSELLETYCLLSKLDRRLALETEIHFEQGEFPEWTAKYNGLDFQNMLSQRSTVDNEIP